MIKYKFTNFKIKRFRSLTDVSLDISDNIPVVICGENNIGKTNVLRALNLFFNYKEDGIFDAKKDFPYHIFYGSRGGRAYTQLQGIFLDEQSHKKNIEIAFDLHDNYALKINTKKATKSEVDAILSQFRYYFVESNNVNVPELIASVLENEGLLPLDKKRSKQTISLDKLDEFINLSKGAIKGIEKKINVCFKKLTDFDGVLKDKLIKIYFAEYSLLRKAIKGMTSLTLFDGNNSDIETKGSGAQRAVFLSLMQYISNNSSKQVIWGVDEPEVFLQPKLQKKVFEVFNELAVKNKQQIVITTHSPHFISLNDLKYTYLYEGMQEEKRYERKPGKIFYEMKCAPKKFSSEKDKVIAIKEHLGISNNDGWALLPYNIIVEGEEDKKYLEALMNHVNISIPNILYSGGVSKIGGLIQFLNIMAKELHFKPMILCLFDNDKEGREQKNKIAPDKLKQLKVETMFISTANGELGGNNYDHEIEDFVPQDLVFEAVNKILKKEGYLVLTKKQRAQKNTPAYRKQQILLFAEEKNRERNQEKDSLEIDQEGRKKQICVYACDLISKKAEQYVLKKEQIEFLKKISQEF